MGALADMPTVARIVGTRVRGPKSRKSIKVERRWAAARYVPGDQSLPELGHNILCRTPKFPPN